ncbi:glycosyltransferase family 2 protein [Oscillibacter valericigenes]|uniref:glycosyltransferase family 2 protein n=1 Tax=Oscillibacter valericigenes TaxID=351091 RepID=UPI001F44533A|nr:glycosyltransferase family 2 protein [Oscillibacter valericigenes]MCF2616688.1 glycosyltransferase family 2 protein [Oscillibacter valericigenes]
MKLLTVTVPCYNSQDYMRHCIESLLPGGERVEILIIDDGSKDDTGRIADEYAEKYPTIVRVIHQENGGHGEGINQGLRHAAGTYFKVVDSDDWLSDDFPAFLDLLEQCEARGGVDLAVTNYYYVHSDGIGDRSINYSSVLPEGRVFTWADTRPFRIHQMLTIHSCTFRTENMRKWGCELPKHTFYEDNLMVYLTLPHTRRMVYMNADLYRYAIGRPDQSVQRTVMMKRYHHQILVTERCFTSCHLDDIQEPRLKRYMRHELFVMFGIAILFTRLNRTVETDAALERMWETCMAFDPKWGGYFRNRSPLRFICLPGRFGQNVSGLVYKLANKVVRFN